MLTRAARPRRASYGLGRIGDEPCVPGTRGHPPLGGTADHAGKLMPGQLHDTVPGTARRADAGAVRLGRRDTDGPILCAEHYSAPYDLLSAALVAPPARLRA